MAHKPTYSELEEQVKQLRGVVVDLERAEKMNQTLYRVSSAVSTTENLDELYASIHEILHKVIELRNFYIAIYHRDDNSIYFPYYRDEHEDDFSHIDDFTETNSLTGEVILAGTPLLLTKEMLAERARQNRIMGVVPEIWMGFPLKVKGDVIGVIAAQSYDNPNQFNKADLDFLTSVSDQIAIAIERKRIEAALRKSEERYRSLLKASPDAIVAYDPQGNIIYINPAFEKTYGWSPAELAGRKIDFVPAHEKEKTQKAVLRNLNGEDVSFETQRLSKDGSLLDIDLKTAIFHDDNGKLLGTIVIHHDITERHRSQAERQRLIAIIENTSDMVSTALPDGRVMYMNRAGREMVGWAADKPLADKFIPDVHPAWAIAKIESKGIPAAIQNGVWNGETALLDAQGNEFPVSQVIMSHRGPGGQLEFLSTIIRDISARLKAEEETRRLQNLLGNIVDSMPSILVGIDDSGRITQWNRRAEEETGIKAEAAAGQLIGEVFPRLAIEMEKIRIAMQERRPQQDSKKAYRGKSETRYEDITVYPLVSNGVQGAVIRVDDVTERVRLEEMMIQSEKMMSVGGLAAGMAHEINNPLAGIMQNIQNARNRMSGVSPADRRVAAECGTTIAAIKTFHEKRGLITMLEAALESGARAAKIVNNMLSFSRMGDASMSKQDLAGLLDMTLELAQSDYDLKRKYDFRKIKIVRDYDPETPPVLCAGSKIQQVFLNIFKNGAEAMAGKDKGGEPHHFMLQVRPDKGMVRVEIKDNGPGMDAAVRKRIFEPFFTTKGGAGGTGLGLSVSYFIITDNHAGSMTVESEPGKGARFIIHLPV